MVSIFTISYMGNYMYSLILFFYKSIRSLCRKINHKLFINKVKNKCIIQPGVGLFKTAQIVNASKDKHKICVGYNSQIHGEIITQTKEGRVIIGDNCFIGPNTKIWSYNQIIIGNRVLIAHNVNILDSNSHSMSAEERHLEFLSCFSDISPPPIDIPSAVIRIEDDVWIGFNTIILKGVTIGCGAVIGAGSIITKDVEPYSIVVGNPQRKIGNSKP